MKNGYEILSPYFMKLVGFCISVYLCIISIKLFVLMPRHAYWQTSAFLVCSIILAAFILCVFFFMFIFIKTDKSKIYLFSLYLLCYIKCVLFLLVFNTRLHTLSDANIMLKIILCFGFLFIFLEFLHAQMSWSFIREKTVFAGIMGITSCVSIYAITAYMISETGLFTNLHMLAYILYASYAIRIFVFSLIGKEAKSSMLFKCSSLVLLLLWMSFTQPNVIGGSNYNRIEYMVIMETFITFGCTQLFPSKKRQTPHDITINMKQKLTSRILSMFNCAKNNISYSNDLQAEKFPMIKGVFMITARFTYFALLAIFITIIFWRG